MRVKYINSDKLIKDTDSFGQIVPIGMMITFLRNICEDFENRKDYEQIYRKLSKLEDELIKRRL